MARTYTTIGLKAWCDDANETHTDLYKTLTSCISRAFVVGVDARHAIWPGEREAGDEAHVTSSFMPPVASTSET